MSVPTEKELSKIRQASGDDEGYHSEFDTALEVKLKELDPEWMEAMSKEYGESGMSRWCA